MPAIGYVLLALVAIAAGIWLAARIEHKNKDRHVDPVNIVHPPVFRHDAVPVAPTIAETPLASPQPPPLPRINVQDQVGDRLRQRKANGSSATSALDGASSEFSERIGMDDCIRIALQIGYSPADVAKFMAGRKYDASEIASMLAEDSELSASELGEIVMPFVDSSDAEARVEETFGIVKEAINLKDDDEDLLQLPSRMGCSDEVAATIIYRKTDMLLGAVLRVLGLCAKPEVAARIAEKLDVDLSDSDEYEAIREDDEVGFDAAAVILKACGKDAEAVIGAEHEYNKFSDDELDEVFSSLSAAGYSSAEIMKGALDADIVSENSCAAVIQAAIGKKVSTESIVAFLQDEDIDVDDLDEEMRELEIETPTRIDILYAYLHTEAKPAEEELPATV